jgi:hypothetical protein
MWMISVPMATWDVTGIPKRAAFARMLNLRCRKRALRIALPTAAPMPRLFFEPSMMAWLMNEPVSSPQAAVFQASSDVFGSLAMPTQNRESPPRR